MREGLTGKTIMAPETAFDGHSWPEHDAFIGVVAFDCLCVPVSDLREAAGFYGSAFAMRVVAGGVDAGQVVLTRGGRVRLALHGYVGTEVPFTRIGASVDSLEAARDMVWNLGIPAVRELGEDSNEDSFAIADPDGHEIRFTERSHGGRRGRS